MALETLLVGNSRSSGKNIKNILRSCANLKEVFRVISNKKSKT